MITILTFCWITGAIVPALYYWPERFPRLAKALAALALALVADGLSCVALRLARAHVRRSQRLRR